MYIIEHTSIKKKKVGINEIPLYVIKDTKINKYNNNITNAEELIHCFLNDIKKDELYKNKNNSFLSPENKTTLINKENLYHAGLTYRFFKQNYSFLQTKKLPKKSSKKLPKKSSKKLPKKLPKKLSKKLSKKLPKHSPKKLHKHSPKKLPKYSPKKLSSEKKCPKDKILNPKTNRCVNKKGKIGQLLLKKQKKSSRKLYKKLSKKLTSEKDDLINTTLNYFCSSSWC